MTSLFLHCFNLSVTAGWMVLVVLLLRFCLKKAPRWITCVLWGLIALRLILPFSIESPVSLIPTAEIVVSTDDSTSSAVVNSGMVAIDRPVNDWLQTPIESSVPSKEPPVQNTNGSIDLSTGDVHHKPIPPSESVEILPEQKPVGTEVKSASRMERILQIAVPTWAIGIAVMLMYELFSFLRVRTRVWDAVRLRGNVWQSERVVSPFIFGLIRPRIFVPYRLNESILEQVLSHERAHLRRFDHWIKPFAFALLSVYWYNPLLWVAYILLCRDIEVACDQRVIRTLDEDGRCRYASALLECGVERRSIAACPLAFGEVSIKQRVKSVLGYRKPIFLVIVISLAICVVAAVCLLTVPLSKAEVITEPSTNDESDRMTTTTTLSDIYPSNTSLTSTTNGSATQTVTSQTTSLPADGPTHTHSFGPWQIAVSPECNTDGRSERVCACGYRETESIAAVGHTYIQNVCVTCGLFNAANFIPDYSALPNTIGNEDGSSSIAVQDGWVYFAADSCRVMKMRTDGTNVATVWYGSSGSVMNVNVSGNWIYFYVMEAKALADSFVGRVRTDGSGFTQLLTSVNVREMLVVEDQLFFTTIEQSFTNWSTDCCPLYTMSIGNGITRRGGSVTQMVHNGYVDCLSSDGDYLYFRYIQQSGEGSVRRIQLDTLGVSTLISTFKPNYFVLDSGRLYYPAPIADSGEYAIQSISVSGGDATNHGKMDRYSDWLCVINDRIYYYGQPSGEELPGIVELNMKTTRYQVIYVCNDQVNCVKGSGFLIMRNFRAEMDSSIVSVYHPGMVQWNEIYI